MPDHSTTGWSDVRDLSSAFAPGSTISDINVSFNLSSTWNDDLYATLSYAPTGGGTGFVVLLNRVGRLSSNPVGHGGSGFNVALDDSAVGDIYTYGGVGSATGLNQADGRFSATLGDGYTTSSRNTSLASGLNGLNANATWTLFFSDYKETGQSTLNSWSLNIEAVPEPITTALIVLGGIFGCFQIVRYLRARKTGVA